MSRRGCIKNQVQEGDGIGGSSTLCIPIWGQICAQKLIHTPRGQDATNTLHWTNPQINEPQQLEHSRQAKEAIEEGI